MKAKPIPIDDGSVPKKDVLHVLKSVAPALGISIQIADDELSVTLVKEGIPEVFCLERRVARKMLHRFNGKYGIRIEFFYHPEMCCSGTDSAQ